MNGIIEEFIRLAVYEMMILMHSEVVWFSYKENRYEVKEKRFKLKFEWTDKKEIWDWDSCIIALARTLDDKLLVVVRSKTNKNSTYMRNKPVELRYMLGVEVIDVSEPKTEIYIARENRPEKKEGPKDRWVFHLKGPKQDDDYWIWDWANEGKDIKSSGIFRLFELIREELSNPSLKSDNIFDVELENQSAYLIPTIYQPSVDSLKNFVREVHCAERPINEDGAYEVEVTIIFNNEQLRKHKYFQRIYEFYRNLRYGRVMDVETFKILVKRERKDNKFIFESIYSNHHSLEDDSIHGDPKPRKRDIKYYFINYNHPIVFINTSNHAMAEHDTNHRLWKWEYIPWMNKDTAPVKFGNKTRKQIDEEFKPMFKFW